MKKEGIQTRKRKPKNPGQGSQVSAGPLPGVIKTEMKTSLQHGKLKSQGYIRGFSKKMPRRAENFLVFNLISEANTY
jgi:hypothetical protein